MKHYDYADRLEAVWRHAVETYRGGGRDAGAYFDAGQLAFLASIGLSAQELYDYAEDYVSEGVPSFATVAMVQDVRRDYFLRQQGGVPSEEQLDPSTLPPKDAEAEGIRWLPRIIPKARARLRGELHPDVMYGCGGDRAFLSENDIHPAEFLRVVARHEDDPDAVVRWVVERARGQ